MEENSTYVADSKVKAVSVKVICLGDSAVGKSKLVERFLLDGYQPHQLSTYALNLYKHQMVLQDRKVDVDFWDTAGQERFQSMHPSYYHQAHACILVFDVTRKVTYKNLTNWLNELRKYRADIPCFCAANKIDGGCHFLTFTLNPNVADLEVTKKAFNFAKKNSIPFYFVSASNGTNVVRVFTDAVRAAVAYKENSTDILDQIMEELEMMEKERIQNIDEQESYAGDFAEIND